MSALADQRVSIGRVLRIAPRQVGRYRRNPVDNPDESDYPMLLREETLIRLYELRDHIDRIIARRGLGEPRTIAEVHRKQTGHLLSPGCCKP